MKRVDFSEGENLFINETKIFLHILLLPDSGSFLEKWPETSPLKFLCSSFVL